MSKQELQSILNELAEQFNAGIYQFRDEHSMIVKPESILEACRVLRDSHHFEVLTEETAVDYWPEQTPRFHLVYRLRSLPKSSGGATYARAMPNCVAFGALTHDELLTEHQPNERTVLKNLYKAMEIYAHAIYELTR